MSGPNQLMRPISLISLFFILPLFPTITTAADLKSDGASLLSLRSALGGGRSLLWNTTTSPCSWTGVVCNSTRVTELHLPGRSLSGQLPAGVIGNLTDLTFLSLRYNSLTGSIPSDITSCKQLQYIYLQGNRFTGQIPAAIFSFSNLIRLNLANNNFSGEISPSFNNLTHLASLYLENNRLTGEIPELNIPSLNLFNVSNNLLHGSIPSKLAIMPASAFEGNSLCGAPLSSCSNNSKKKLSGGAIAGIVIGAVVALIVLLFLIIIMCCRRSKEKKEGAVNVASAKAMDVEMAEEKAMADKERKSLGVEQSGAVAGAVKEGAKGGGIDKSLVFIGNYVPSRVYDLDDLLRASAEVLGKGTYGTTYKASLEIGITVAVKRLKDVIVKEKELKGKMEEIGRMNHENLVPLKAYHCSPNEKLIVCDYMPMGSLSALLHGNRGGGRTPLNWETRSMIALGAARGITYIHSQSPTTSHGNIKSSNILLSNSYQARVSDFGLAQLATPTAPPNRIAGHRAPEVTDSRKVSQKADVYSFGVFLLELLTGKAPTHTHTLLNEQGVDLPRWVQSVVQQEWSAEVFDEELLRYQNVEEEMVQLLQLAVDCTAHYPDTRPSMAEITNRIEQICGSTSRREQELFEDIVDDGENQQSSP